MIIKQDQHHNVICDQFIELINNAGTMLQCKGFRATKAYLIKEITEAAYVSTEREVRDPKARQCQCFFDLLAFNDKMKSTGQMVTFLIKAHDNFKAYKTYDSIILGHKHDSKAWSSEKINLNLFAEMLAKV